MIDSKMVDSLIDQAWSKYAEALDDLTSRRNNRQLREALNRRHMEEYSALEAAVRALGSAAQMKELEERVTFARESRERFEQSEREMKAKRKELKAMRHG